MRSGSVWRVNINPPKKIFTVSEANKLLPRVIPLIEQLQGLKDSISETNEELVEISNKLAQGNGYPIHSLKEKLEELTQHQLHLIDAFYSAFKQLESSGCLMKDLQMGLIDFYGMRQDEMIFLCWKIGEDKIAFWHDLEEGYPGRKTIDNTF